MLTRLVFALTTATCLAVVAHAAPPATQAPVSDAEILQSLKMRVDQQHQATGVVVGIVDTNGERIIAYGKRGLNDQRAVDGDTVFDIGSITKVITALLLADIVQHGEIKLDDPVQKYLPHNRVTVPTYQRREITFADLATHTSGLPLRPTNLRSQDADNKYAGYSREDLYAFLSGYKLTRPVGSKYEYSNVGFGLIGAALSEHTGHSWAELVRTRITVPMGMNDTRVDLTSDMKQRTATGYALDIASLELTPSPHWDMGALESAGALRSTAHDLMKLLRAALGPKPSPLTQALDLTIATRRPGGMEPATEIALGWNILRDNGHEIAWKNGNVGGFRTFIGFDRSTRRGIVALANAQTANGVDDIGLHALDPSSTVDTHIPRPHKEIALASDVLDRYVGHYRYSDTDSVTITRDGSHLYCTTGPDKLQLFAETERDFFLKVADIQITFDAIVDGRATKAIWHQNGQEQVGTRVE